jgi:protein-L-isoaspartate(D-aspartate) O-methyltransferase
MDGERRCRHEPPAAHRERYSGKVTAIEFEPELAARAKANLTPYRNVSVVQEDGSSVAFDAPMILCERWSNPTGGDLAGPAHDGGRLVLPLTTDLEFTSSNWSNMHLRGAVFLVTRKGEEFRAQWISPVAIFPCEGMRDAESEKALAAAFDSGEHKRVTRLYPDDELPTEECWIRGPGWCLAYA